MNSADSRNWQFAGKIEGQGIRSIEIGNRRLLVVQILDDVLVVNAACAGCGQGLNTEAFEGQSLVCAHCGFRLGFSKPDASQCLPIMVVDTEIYVLLSANGDESD